MKTAVVVGALGVIGRYIVDKLASLPDWQVIGLSRRKGEPRERVRYISVDLTEPRDAEAKLAGLKEATHVFYAAFSAGGGRGVERGANSSRIATCSSIRSPRSSRFDQPRARRPGYRQQVLRHTPRAIQHPGARRRPAAMRPDFIRPVDWLTAFQRDKRWGWTEVRPHTLCGFAPGTAMSILPVIAVYAAIIKAFGRPFASPASPAPSLGLSGNRLGAFRDRAAWAATDPRCANQTFNITNGDYFRWLNVWPKLAKVFDMPAGEVADHPARRPTWPTRRRCGKMWRRSRPEAVRFDELAAWPFGDYVFGSDWDVMTSTVKARQLGFHDVVDSEDMFVRLLTRFREARIVP